MTKALGYAAKHSFSRLKPLAFDRSEAGPGEVSGSLIGSIAETQDVLAFCAKHNIAPDNQVIPIQEINDAYKKVGSGEMWFWYRIDMASLKRNLARHKKDLLF